MTPSSSPGRNRPGEAAQLEQPAILDLDAPQRQPVGRRPHEDLAGAGLLLQPRGDVDGLAGRERRVGVVRHDLARLEANAGLEAELAHRVDDREGRPDAALGVVLVRLRDAERGHDGVAGELLDDAAVRDDAVRDAVEEPRHLPAPTSGSLAETSSVEPTRSTNRTVASLRSTSEL